MRRLQFGIRSLFVIVTLTCTLLAGWQQPVATRLWIEPNALAKENINRGYRGKATIVHGRFFSFKGSRHYERVRWLAVHTATAGQSFSFKFADICETEYKSPGFYTFAFEVPAIGPRARADIGIRTSTGATGQISFGDLSLPATTPTVDVDPFLGY